MHNHLLHLVLILYGTIILIKSEELKTVIDDSETFLKGLSSKIQDLYKKKCDLISSKKCFTDKSNCYFDSCTSKVSDSLVCASDFKSIVSFNSTENKTCSNIKLNPKYSSVKLADSVNVSINNTIVKEDICYSSSLDMIFPEVYKKNQYIKWQYYGTPSGVFRKFPSGVFCSQYDHRQKDWYDKAIRRPINFLFAIETSGKMNNSGKKDLLIKLITEIVNKFDDSVWFGSVSISSLNDENDKETEKKVLFNSNFLQSTKENKENFINELNSFGFKGVLNVTSSEIEAFLIKNKENYIGTNCEEYNIENTIKNTIVIYLVGNNINEGNSNFTKTEKNNTYNSIFVSIDNINNQLLIQNQCKENKSLDIYLEVNTPFDIITIKNKIFEYSSLGVERNGVIWKKYNDTFLLGEVLTGSIPIYYENRLLGVYGIDFSIEEIKRNFSNSQELDFYLKRDQQCILPKPVNLCQIEKIRQSKCYQDSKSFDEKCKSFEMNNTLTCGDNLINELYPNSNFTCVNEKRLIEKSEEVSKDKYLCCGNNNSNTLINLISMNISMVSPLNSSDNVKNLITPLKEYKDDNKKELNNQTLVKDEAKESDVKFYFFVIVVILVILGIVAYMYKKNSIRAYTNNSNNRELSEMMTQSNRGNYYG